MIKGNHCAALLIGIFYLNYVNQWDTLDFMRNTLGVDIDLSLVKEFSIDDALHPRNFQHFTLTSSHIQTIVFLSVSFCGTLAFVANLLIGERPASMPYSADKTEDAAIRKRVRKRLSWVLSLWNSLFMTVAGFAYWYHKFGTLWDPRKVIAQLSDAPDDLDGFWIKRDNFGGAIMIWFCVFNFMDIIVGSLLARECLDPLTTWVHHPFFSFLMVVGLTGNLFPFGDHLVAQLGATLGTQHGLTVFMRSTVLPAMSTPTYTGPFVCSIVEELPTFFLALGSVFPSLRSDIAFGLTFFVLRIVFQALLFFSYRPWNFGKLILGLPFLMHIFWFRSWSQKYLPHVIRSGGDVEKREKRE